jgi:putative aminopeptidase FrvX
MVLDVLVELMAIPGLSGHEDRVAHAIARHLERLGLEHHSDRLGNLMTTLPGDANLPSVMIFAHMDQLGFVVRKIEASGLIRLEKLGGVPIRALPAQAVMLCTDGGDVPGIISNKSHHATSPEEKGEVVPIERLAVDAGFGSKEDAEAAGVDVGTPVVYQPTVTELAGGRIAGTSIDDRAGCAALIALAEARQGKGGPTLHLVWSVQEEHNLRGVLPTAVALEPDIAISVDTLLATDTPEVADRGDVELGGGPAISMYSFHGRGTLNGVIPHPALVELIESTAADVEIATQRSAHSGLLTDLSYIQFMGANGVACLDLGIPVRYSHSAREVADPSDASALVALLDAALDRITPDLRLVRSP